MYKNKYDLSFGADPELFVTYETSSPKGEGFVKGLPFAMPPARLWNMGVIKAVGGTPKHPDYYVNDNGKIIGDGVALEVNLHKPYKDPVKMAEHISELISEFEPWWKGPGYATSLLPAVNFDYGSFWDKDVDPEKDPYLYWSTIFGCDADADAFNTELKCEITDVTHHPFRYAGYHIHLSGDADIDSNPRLFIQLLALTVGNYTVLNSKFGDLEKMRSKYYGKAGKYRTQKYPNGQNGVEYRTPSNSVFSYSKDAYETMFSLVNTSLYLLKKPRLQKKLLKEYTEPTKIAVENADKDLAGTILSLIGV